MATRAIVKTGDPVLHKQTRPVKDFGPRLATMLDDMRETLAIANGVGLAAPQIGILRRVCIVLDTETDEIIELVNPEIIAREGEEEQLEGCLSFPDVWALVPRPNKVTVRALDRNGNPFEVTGEGLLAQAFSHEIDHLDGIVFTDRMSRRLTDKEVRELMED